MKYICFNDIQRGQDFTVVFSLGKDVTLAESILESVAPNEDIKGVIKIDEFGEISILFYGDLSNALDILFSK